MYIEKLKDGKESEYAIKQKHEDIGTFILDDQGNGIKRLRRLQLDGNVTTTGILYIFELIQTYAKIEELRELQVKSHSQELSTILKHQQFVLCNQKEQLWTYTVDCGKVE
ncbi:hypothetical protein [Halobacillus sp. Marseille-Q1614]|uniref:hypothetical protein n=1 Tax=Halobacillus sp. Marseille-Q1614 TaxID=2709134 RepID=UPI00156F9343|nr:hypothetical protein [Halobacillus sp. Marseille-Q1614]